MRRNALPYLGAAASALAYALWLESRPRKYHPDVTWLNVTGGVALTGAWVAARFALEDGPRSPWWAWRVTALMFVATGAPVVSVELAQEARRLARLRHVQRSTRDAQATAARKRRGGDGARG